MFSFGTPLKPMFNVLILTACASGVLVPAVQAQEVPPAALRYGGAPPAAAEEGVTSLAIAPPPSTQDECPSGDVCYSLAIDYAEGRLRNPAFAEESPQGFDDVRLRAYVGKVVDAEGNVVDQPNKFVAPAVEISPGDTFRLMLHNRLPKPEDMVLPGLDDNGNPLTCDTSGEVDHNEPHCSHFNLTNMHTHGLWVSPAANSDNVLLTVHPNVRFTYEYNIPNDHPSGTFWYHAHRHGSTAVQVSSGMAGVLLIRGDRQPVAGANGWARHGDLDVILPRKSDDYAGSPSFRERVMLFQQIAYGCRDDAGALKTNDDGTWRCDEGDVGTLEPGPGNAFEQIGFGSWPGSGRHTAINGEVRKSFDGAVAGEVERWRLIHGGVRETIRLTIRKAADASSGDGGDAMTDYLAGGMTRAEEAAQLDTLCDGDPVPVVGVATDGLTRPDIRTSEQVWLQPAYREDILVTFPEPGRYCIIDAAVSGAENINTNPSQRSLLGLVTVGAGSGIGTEGPVAHILDQLAASVEANIDTPARAKVLEDLENGRLDAFVKHRPIPAEDVTGRQTVGFNISFGAAGLQFQIGEIADNFQVPGFGFQLVNPQSYNPMRLDRELPLGGTEEWFLTSFGGGGHPFHIHVNPFKIIDIRKTQPDAAHPDIDASDPSSWVDVSAPGPDNPSQYAGLKDVWKDTIFTLPGHLIRFRTRYERYIGDFVLHCHILDHEDEGMMQNVRISIPDGRGGFDVPMTEHVMGGN